MLVAGGIAKVRSPGRGYGDLLKDICKRTIRESLGIRTYSYDTK